MNSAQLGRTIRDAGKAFLASRLGDLYEKRNELDDSEGFDKIAESYFRKQSGHHDTSIDETRERISLAKEIIDSDMTLECLEILADTKSLKPEFRQKAKQTLKKLEPLLS
ncbi:MAG: hypothetical protein ACI4NM_08120 [Bullifex sp.]